jgi:hypothetical protein
MNLYVWGGVEPPTLETLTSYIGSVKGESYANCAKPESAKVAAQGGLTSLDQFFLLNTFGFPSVVGLYVIPMQLSARDVFPRWMEMGCGLLFMIRVRVSGNNYGHSVVASSCASEWIEVLDSMDGLLNGRLMPFDFGERLSEEIMTNPFQAHGCKSRYGWDTVPIDAPILVNGSSESIPLGIERLYIVAHPV